MPTNSIQISYQNESAWLETPNFSLSPDAVGIFSEQTDFEKMSEKDFIALYKARKVAHEILREKGYKNFLNYSQIGTDRPFQAQLVSFASLPSYLENGIVRNLYSFFLQLRVVVNSAFFPTKTTPRPSKGFTSVELPKNDPAIFTGFGALTKVKQIQKQLLYPKLEEIEKEKAFVLYNYAPLKVGDNKLHFLIIPNPQKPARNFEELEEDQYVRVQELVQKILHISKKKFGNSCVIHVFDKTGQLAGQTQELFHTHVLIQEKASEALSGRLKLIGRMLAPPSPLSEQELQGKMSELKTLFFEN